MGNYGEACGTVKCKNLQEEWLEEVTRYRMCPLEGAVHRDCR